MILIGRARRQDSPPNVGRTIAALDLPSGRWLMARMRERLILYGAGGHAKVVGEAFAETFPAAEVAGVDDRADAGRQLLGWPIVGNRDWLLDNWHDVPVMPAIGDNRARLQLLSWLTSGDRRIATVVHPRAVISASAELARGVFVAAGAIVNAAASLAEGVILNTGASIDHDCRIGRCAHIAPGARLCGNVEVGEAALLGTGCAVIPGVRIGNHAVVGAGSVVIGDIADGEVWAGNPARPLPRAAG